MNGTIVTTAMIIILAASSAFAAVGPNIGSGNIIRALFELGGSEHFAALQHLNDAWVLPEDYSLEVKQIDGVAGSLTIEWVQAKNTQPDKAILQLHGGAYTRSLKDNGATYRRSAVQYAKLSGAAVLTVDYRVAPEHPHPAALEDAVAAYNWLLSEGYQADRIIIAGDSAGGGLALATALYLADHDMPMPAAIITMSAWTNLNYGRLVPAYVGDNPADHPYISPIYGNYEGFSHMLMQVGGSEALLNDTIVVADNAKAAGVAVQQTSYAGMFHVFQMLFPQLPEANAAWDEVAAFIAGVFGQ
jgi:monoterpene epsilon-lactone hydrolase